jgi:hypothetical protein
MQKEAFYLNAKFSSALTSAHPETTFSGDPACPGKMNVSEKLRNTRDA